MSQEIYHNFCIGTSVLLQSKSRILIIWKLHISCSWIWYLEHSEKTVINK